MPTTATATAGVQVSVVNYVISANETDYQMLEASMVKFTADASTNASMIYLHDETSFQLLENNFEGFFQYNDGTAPMPAGATDYENAMIPWEDVKAFAEFTPNRGGERLLDRGGLPDPVRDAAGVPAGGGGLLHRAERGRTWPTTRTAWRCSTG